MGRKTISQNHPWHYFDISFALSSKSRNERSDARTWHQYKMAQLHAANCYSVRQAYLTEGTRKDWKVTQEKRCLKGSSKKLTHRPICRQGQTVFCHGLSETLRINIYFDVTCDRYQFDSQHFNGHMSQVTFPLTS